MLAGAAGCPASAHLLRGSPQGPTCPTLRANPYPRSYGSILPTSLIYIVLSTRRLFTLETCCGYEYDLGVKTIPSRGFSRIVGGAPDPRKGAGLCRPWNPSSGQTDFRVMGPSKERELFPGPRRCLRVQLRCRGESTSRCRNINRLPFRQTAHEAHFQRNYPMS